EGSSRQSRASRTDNRISHLIPETPSFSSWRDKQEEQHMSRIIGRVIGFLVVGLLASPPLFAQNTASIAGTVKDSSGSVLPGVTITATQTETSLERTAISDAEGRYTIGNLPVGPYRLEFMLAGFRTSVQTGIVLQVAGSPTLNASLEI